MIVEAVGWSVFAGYVAYTFWLGPLMERDKKNRAILTRQFEQQMWAQQNPTKAMGCGLQSPFGLGLHFEDWKAAKKEQEDLELARITPPQRLLEYHPEGEE